MMNFSDKSTIGMMLTVLGVLFSFSGIVLFLDKGLIALGNIMFLVRSFWDADMSLAHRMASKHCIKFHINAACWHHQCMVKALRLHAQSMAMHTLTSRQL